MKRWKYDSVLHVPDHAGKAISVGYEVPKAVVWNISAKPA